MTARIHFDDNVYILQVYIQTLQTTLKLEADPQFFLDKCIDDFFFLDTTLCHLHKALSENEFLVKRQEYFRLLLHCKQEFISVANGLVQGQYTMSAHTKPYASRILQSAKRQEDEYDEIRRKWMKDQETDSAPTGLSSEEYEFLLGEDYSSAE